MFKCLPNPFCSRNVEYIDRRHCSLQNVPDDVLKHHRTLEELFLDSNQLSQLPKGLYKLTHLRRLSLSDNEITELGREIGMLTRLQELNISRNEISEIPDELRQCETLQFLDASGNPLQNGLPQGISYLTKLSRLIVNDSSLTNLPEDIDRLVNLKYLEVRENLLRMLPSKICGLVNLCALDVGNNEITELPGSIDMLANLEELWTDINEITALPEKIGSLRNLQCLDVSSNKLTSLPSSIGDLAQLTNLELSGNRLKSLPDSIGNLSKLQILKLDENELVTLPESIGRCSNLTELILTSNRLETLPRNIGNLNKLENLNADQNHLTSLPNTIIGCCQLGILSLRYNHIGSIPCTISHLKNLQVLDLIGNRLKNLPGGLLGSSLKAIWLSENQTHPLIRFQEEVDEETGDVILSCFLLPQQQYSSPSSANLSSDCKEKVPTDAHGGLHKSEEAIPTSATQQTENHRSGSVKFAESTIADDETSNSGLRRQSTPQPKDLRTWKRRLNSNRNSIDADTIHEMNSSYTAAVTGVQGRMPLDILDFHEQSKEGMDTTDKFPTFVAPRNIQISVDCRQEDTEKGKTNGHAEWKATNLVKATPARNYEQVAIGKTLLPTRISISKKPETETFGFVLTSRGNEKKVIVTATIPTVSSKLKVGDEVLELDGVNISHLSEPELTSLLQKKRSKSSIDLTIIRRREHAMTVFCSGGVMTEQSDMLFQTEAGEDFYRQTSSTADQAASQFPPLSTHRKTPTYSRVIAKWGSSPYPILLLTLKRKEGSLGLSIVGGIDQPSRPFDVQSRGVFVFKVQSQGAAIEAGLQVGDRLLMVNDVDVSGSSHKEVVDTLIGSDDLMKLVVRRDPEPEGLQEIVLDRKHQGNHVGMKLNGGVNGKRVHPTDLDDEGIFITEVLEGSIAHRSGNVRAGMRILAINGQSVMGCGLEDAHQCMAKKTSSPIITITVCDGYTPVNSRDYDNATSFHATTNNNTNSMSLDSSASSSSRSSNYQQQRSSIGACAIRQRSAMLAAVDKTTPQPHHQNDFSDTFAMCSTSPVSLDSQRTNSNEQQRIRHIDSDVTNTITTCSSLGPPLVVSTNSDELAHRGFPALSTNQQKERHLHQCQHEQHDQNAFNDSVKNRKEFFEQRLPCSSQRKQFKFLTDDEVQKLKNDDERKFKNMNVPEKPNGDLTITTDRGDACGMLNLIRSPQADRIVTVDWDTVKAKETLSQFSVNADTDI